MREFSEFQKFTDMRIAQKGQRQKRVGGEVRAKLTQILPTITQWVPELKPLRLTILNVSMTANLRSAMVMLHPLQAGGFLGESSDSKGLNSNVETPEFQREVLQALHLLVPQIRKQLASALNLRFVPEIRFCVDRDMSDFLKLETTLHHAQSSRSA